MKPEYYNDNTKTHKKCPVCNKILPRTEFYKDSSRKDKITAQCKSCKLAISKQWQKDNNYRMNERAKIRARERRYGLSDNEHFLLLEKQNYCCAICNEKVDFSSHIDHDHETGKVRGILCRRCNMGIGFMRDDILILQAAIRYLS